MKRHGVPHDQLSEVSGRLGAARFEGWTIHLPMVAKGRVAEAERLSNAALNAMSAPVWLSHVTLDEYASLQRTLGVGPDQTMAFGDYLNDLEMLAQATHSFAMGNAHPRVVAASRRVGYRRSVGQAAGRSAERFEDRHERSARQVRHGRDRVG